MNNELSELIYKIDKKRKIFVRILIIFVLIVSAFLFVVLYHEAISLPEKYAGSELYQKRIDDAFIYAGVASLGMFVFTAPVIILINGFFRRYKDILLNMPKDSLNDFYYYHDNILKGFNKLTPPYVIDSNKLIILKLLSNLEINIKDIETINMKRTQQKGSVSYFLKITTSRDNHRTMLPAGSLYANEFIGYFMEKIKSKNNKINITIK